MFKLLPVCCFHLFLKTFLLLHQPFACSEKAIINSRLFEDVKGHQARSSRYRIAAQSANLWHEFAFGHRVFIKVDHELFLCSNSGQGKTAANYFTKCANIWRDAVVSLSASCLLYTSPSPRDS